MDFFTHVTALAGLAVLLVQQILKLKVVPVTFANRWPVETNIVLSVIAAIVVSVKTSVAPVSWTDWVGLVAVISITAAIAYNQVIGKSAQIKSLEG